MATTIYYLKGDEKGGFIKWLGDNKKFSRIEQHAGYIGSILDNVLEPLECGVLIKDIGYAIQYKYSYKKVFEGLDVIYSFLKRLVWISNNIQNNAKIDDYIKQNKLNLNSINNWPTAIKSYKEFLQELLDNGEIKPSTSSKDKYLLKENGWNDAIKRLNQEVIDNLSLNGTDNIVSGLGGEYKFIQYILKDSYFFTPKFAHQRFKEIIKIIKNCGELYARNRIGSFKFTNLKKSINIKKDGNGNLAVQDLIKNNTGYTVSKGYDSIFLYYTISHIWAKATDPRYFTNIWNIAIVATWANFLLDKEGSEDELTKKVINTFRAICMKHYEMDRMDLKLIDIDIQSIKPDPNFVVPGKYAINVISNKRKNQDYGKISQDGVTIP